MDILTAELRFVHLTPASSPLPTPAAYRPAALDWPSSPEVDGDTWELGPALSDDQWHAEQSDSYHFDGPTPHDALDPPPPFDADELAEAGRRSDALPLVDPADEPDWDALADESAALDRLCA